MATSSTTASDDSYADAGLPWHLAATLRERLPADAVTETDRERGEKRFAMWTEFAPFSGDPDTLDDHLTPLDVTRTELTSLLGEPQEALARRLESLDEPPWHQRFVAWWRAGTQVPEDERLVGASLDLLEVARPLLEGAAQELAAAAQERLQHTTVDAPLLQDPAHIVDQLLASLPTSELFGHVSRTMVLELNVARLEERLAGSTSEERYASFISLMRDEPQALAIWREYPVLARLLVERLGYWIDTRLELLDAMIEDLPVVLQQGLLSQPPTRLEKLNFGAGDSHRGGRSVVIVTFDTDRVVYKPRPMVMDAAFDNLLAWVNDGGLPHQLRRVRIADRGNYGWTEYVDAATSTDEAGGDRYAWRLGALAALLYLLHATDVHYENVLAEGEHPVLVDLEALLHSDKSAASVKVDGVRDVVAETLLNSVQTLGVLPNRMLVKGDEGTFDVDLSAMAAEGGQLSPIPVPDWEDANTDTMRLVRRRREMDAQNNRPTDAEGGVLDLVERSEWFVDGFNQTYRLLAHGREALLAPDGPIAAFGQARSRLIARPTHRYARVIMESAHPDFLRDGLDRERALARVCAGHDDMDGRDEMIRNEIAELWHGDVPVFTVDADTGYLRTGTTEEVIGASAMVPMTEVTSRLRRFDEADRTFQEWIIKSSIATTVMGGEDARWPNWHRPRQDHPASADDFAQEALRVARRLDELSISDENNVGWIGMSLVDEEYWMLVPAPTGLYVGTGGIAHALDAVAAVTGDDAIGGLATRVFDGIASRAVRTASELEDVSPESAAAEMGIGPFGDLGGVLYSLSHAAVRRDRPDYIDAACALLPSLQAFAEVDELLDIVSGSAGAVLAALALERAAPGRGGLEFAQRCARRLLETRREWGDGAAWLTQTNPDAPLTGFSHGASGMAVALARLHLVAPDPAYPEAIADALRYEAANYDAELANWRDLRSVDRGGKAQMNAWCHGAPGVALARNELITALGGHPSGVLDTQLSVLLEADRHQGVLTSLSTGLDTDPVSGIGNHSVCHGDVGNLLILEKAHRSAQEPAAAEVLPRVWRTLLAEGRTNGWLCGVPHGIETPGLMVGIAGIAWGLARMAAPEQVPDILSLDPPRGPVPSLADGART